MLPSSLADPICAILMVGLISFFIKKSYDYACVRKRRYDLPLSICLLLECSALLLVMLNRLFQTPDSNRVALGLALLATSGVVYFSYQNKTG